MLSKWEPSSSPLPVMVMVTEIPPFEIYFFGSLPKNEDTSRALVSWQRSWQLNEVGLLSRT